MVAKDRLPLPPTFQKEILENPGIAKPPGIWGPQNNFLVGGFNPFEQY